MKISKMVGVVSAFVLAGGALAGCSSDKETEETEAVVVEEVAQSETVEVEDVSLFVTENNLAGEYALEGISNSDVLVVSEEELEFVMAIDEYGNISGEICNTFNASVNDEGETSEAVTTRMFCETPEGIMDLEEVVVNSFGGTLNVVEGGVVLEGETESIWTALE